MVAVVVVVTTVRVLRVAGAGACAGAEMGVFFGGAALA